MMDLGYLLVPFLAWLMAGCTKFAINSLRTGKLAWSLIGYGGMPSNHSAIVGSATALVILREGISHPAVAIGVALIFIVTLDANSLRRTVGKHAAALNALRDPDSDEKPLRERMGHSRLEILAGLAVGALAAIVMDYVFPAGVA